MKSSNYICTIRPSNNSPERLERFLYQGMCCVRLNTCHGKIEEHLETIENMKLARQRYFEKMSYISPAAIAFDIQGPGMRIGMIDEKFQETGAEWIENGPKIVLNQNPKFADSPMENTVFINQMISTSIERGFEISVGSQVILKVEDIFGDAITCSVIKTGIVKSFMQVHIPKLKKIDYFQITEKDKSDIEVAIKNDIDFLFCSFVESGEHVANLRNELKGTDIKIISKIQSKKSLENLNEIVEKSDGIIISPSIEFDSNSSLKIEKIVIDHCREMKKPCFMTLSSKIDTNEISEVDDWIFQKCDGIILTGHVSNGKLNPIEAMKTISKLKMSQFPKSLQTIDLNISDFDEASVQGCAMLTKLSNVAAIIMISSNFNQFRLMNHFRPDCEIVAVSSCENEKLARQANIFDKLSSLIFLQNIDGTDDFQLFSKKFIFGVEFSMKRGFAKRGDTVVIFDGQKHLSLVYLIPLNSE